MERARIHDQLWDLCKVMQVWKATGKVTAYGINPYPHMSIAHCAHVLGFRDVTDMYNNWNDKSSRAVAQMLNRDHGLTIYKVLLAQVNDREEQKHAD